MNKNPNHLAIPDFLAGGGEMGERIRNFDWTKTSLGHPSQWEQSLKTCVSIMLTSSQPIWIGWGKEMIKLYNDPYKAIVGGKHPKALGLPASIVWKDIWMDIAPLLQKVMLKNEGIYVESQLLIMERYGYPEETYYTFSYSPVPGDNGLTAGMICYNTPDTERIINQRSLQTLQELGSLTQKKDVDEVLQAAVQILERNNKDFPFAIISTIDEERKLALPVAHGGISKDHPELPVQIDLADPGSAKKGKYLFQAVSQNEMVWFENPGSWKNLPTGGWTVPPKSFVHVPIKKGSKKYPLAVLTLALNPYRQFDDTFKNFIQLVADQVSLEINTVLAHEEERKRAKALAEIDKAKTIFFSNISHEFRTPLTLMLGPLEEMMNHQQTVLNASLKKNLETTHRNAMRLLRMVNTLLDFSKIEAGRQDANFVATDVFQFTKSLVSNFRSLLEKAGLELIVESSEETALVMLDRQMWEKIVFNLLSNAFKYTLEGSITVRLSTGKGFALLQVIDTGVGIPESELPNIFERFHRVQNSSGRSFEGTGIGLSLIKELVQLHNGKITVESTLAKGSSFAVKIPLIITGGAIAASPAISGSNDFIASSYLEEAAGFLKDFDDEDWPKRDQSNEKKKIETILVVDDNADMREHIYSVLSTRFNVVKATNGLEALQKMKETKTDLVLSDIMMPVMDGIDLLKEIKKNETTAQTPVILLTARAGEESRIEGLEIGADDYLIKPFSAKELLARISSQIHTSRLRRLAEQNLNNVIRQAPVIMMVLRGEKFIIDIANERALEIWGKKEEEVTRHSLFEIFPRLNNHIVKTILQNVLQKGQRYSNHEVEIDFEKNDGLQKRYFLFTYEPLRSIDGDVEGILVAGADITAEKITSKKIQASQRELQNIFRQAPVSIIFYRGNNFVVDVANDVALEIWGKTEAQVLGKPVFEISPELKASQGPLLDGVFKGGQTYVAKELPVAYRKNDGELYNGYFDLVYQPARTVNGDISGIIAIASEVTESVRARKKIEESERQLSELANAMPQLVWMADEKGVVFYYNDRIKEFKGSRQTKPGIWEWDGLVHPDDIAATVDAWHTAISNGQPYEAEHRILMQDGCYRWFLSRGYPQKNEVGVVKKWFGTATYIHEQKTFSETLEKKVGERTEELNKANASLATKNYELERQNEELASFTYVASHDLQEPLRKIQVLTSRILEMEKEKFSAASADYFNRIRSAAFRMQNLIEALLNYSKANSFEKTVELTDLNLLIKDLENNFRDLVEEKNVQIHVTNLPVIEVIPHQFQQLLYNLISNSIKYSRPGIPPVISINAQLVNAEDLTALQPGVHGRYWKISVTDNGIGFEQQFENKIFELFQRLHGRNEYTGTGIGLAICKKIVQNHNGFITAKGVPGKGSAFDIYIPVGENYETQKDFIN